MVMLKMRGERELALATNNNVIADAEGSGPWRNELERARQLVNDTGLLVSTVELRGAARPFAD